MGGLHVIQPLIKKIVLVHISCGPTTPYLFLFFIFNEKK